MKITRLRLLGFKSFVEPTELVIEPGLTGVVGPNGCGKSNLLEALRWVMGETSHKSMRAAAMDDVIFAGTTGRPPRNSAEVTIFLDNSARLAPAEFNNSDHLEITRRIEREAGSAYRINGREARARDIKILFEDAATGARSPALVRQGQIAEIVNAKPEQRRRILEDAAGVAGLHSRRHEAELRLKAAEANLERLTDVLGQLNTQVEGLKRQARAARRYKEISDAIRRAEALLMHLTWVDAQTHVDTEETNLRNALALLGTATEEEARALAEEARIAETMNPLREEEARRAAAVGRLRIEQENLEQEAKRAADREQEMRARAEHFTADIAREEDVITEAREILANLAAELETLALDDVQAEETKDRAHERLEETQDNQRLAEARLADLTTKFAEQRAHRQTIEANLSERQGRIAKLRRQLDELHAQTQEITSRAPDAQKLQQITDAGKQLAEKIAKLEVQALAAEDHARALIVSNDAAREGGAAARLRLATLRAERETLVKLLIGTRQADYPPIVDRLRVAAGYETALGAALGDDLEAPAAEQAAVHWRNVPAAASDPALPASVKSLSAHVKAPPELDRRLRQTGIVDDVEQGRALQAKLKPGQRLVTRAGDLWRWDGFTAAAEGATPAAQRLAERNRLSSIELEEAEARTAVATAEAAERHASEALTAARTEEQRLRQLGREAQTMLAKTRDNLTAIERAARETESKLASVTGARSRAEEELALAQSLLAEAEQAAAGLAAADDLETPLAEAKTKAEARRMELADARSALANIERDRRMRANRRSAINVDRERWTARSAGADKQIEALKARLAEASAELETLANIPAAIDEKRGKLLTALSEAEAARQQAADAVAEADTSAKAAVLTLRAAQGAVAEAREGRARTEARLEAARTRRQDVSRQIREELDVAPENCLALAEPEPGAPLPELSQVERKLNSLRGDRERLGGVNLAADQELETLSAQTNTMETEKADIESAIAKLRGGIGQLNREAHKRLNEAFEAVNAHFGRLFTTLFGGGEARLEMVAGEDPLQGGLEIIAKPPGKKPATLSLLSGGEQSLTAMSLIFAVFLTNPSPICVLDEVDAPLDDANVDRFCRLLENMAEETATRFLVITHHPMTMSRMSRLFGVTMAEKGISQLVSVDLQTAQRYREAG
ncbi:chromosome segregation protein SMC [Hyphomicrobium sulfonivorans]|uniref:chromosome segregation protein SMC n=1 Tax=Hyphomicrobium sulfonivorans TaxID=121290 RepID=UPI001570ABED|nr:chromosome segregation protein SMC [Hyphomicrobium sulfonivorans]MBI1648857.1 chromosome segregation protein SMC [Hyphomicrobium sulfonivorans]NSL70608.1 chromosome segregation protein SMC [Hyphomicrobium sulfonivorans]